MALLNLETQKKVPPAFSLFNLAFRPFFLGASMFAVFGMLIWALLVQGLVQLPNDHISLLEWHGHEMVFGFATAVIAGFLLTAVKNWTQVNTPYGIPLAILFSLWLMARITWFIPEFFPAQLETIILLTALFDISFNVLFAIAFAYPIIVARQWQQLGLLSKVILIAIFNTLFYLGLLGIVENGTLIGIYGGFFIVLAVILTMGRRVIPFFIEKGIDKEITLANPSWIDRSNLVLFLLLAINELFFHELYLTSLLASALLVIGTVRLYNWHHPDIWKNGMLWSLYLGMVFIQLGFLFYALTWLFPSLQTLAIHALAVGGLGILTLSMMMRVSLGHTGRNVNEPPSQHRIIFGLMISATIVRVLIPVYWPDQYGIWLALSQALWITAFALFAYALTPIWIKKRIDGHFG